MSMGWLVLVIASLSEVAGTIAAKQSHGFTNLLASVLMVCFYVSSFIGLSIAMKTIDMSVAYPLWTGISILATSFLGVAILNESVTLTKSLSLFFLMIGIIGLTASEQLHGG